MKRVLELIANIRTQYPNDDFFTDFNASCRINPDKRKYYHAYNDALMVLDDESWKILKHKALEHYMNHRPGQKKQGFFNQLNEAFAYRHLIREGFEDVQLIKEDKKNSCPDLAYSTHRKQRYCEVKTLGISDELINRRETISAFDGADYVWLKDGFLNKFNDAVCKARDQISAFEASGLVYIIINFDDFTLDYYQNYKKQLVSFSRDRGFNDLFIKIGVSGIKSICI